MDDRKALPDLPFVSGKSKQELEHLDKFDEYIREAQSREKETVTKNLNLAARTATKSLLSSHAFKHVVECIKCISKDHHSHKETAVYLVDSIMVHAAHYCDEIVQDRLERHFSPFVQALFKRALTQKRGRWRNAVAERFLKKILPKWKKHSWFERYHDSIKETCLKQSSASVKMQFDGPDVPDFEDENTKQENEESKMRAAEAGKTLMRIQARQRAGATLKPMRSNAHILARVPATPNADYVGAPRTPILNRVPATPNLNVFGTVPMTPGVPMPGTPGLRPMIPGTPRMGMIPGTPGVGMIPGTPGVPIPGTPGVFIPGTPRVGLYAPTTPGAMMARAQPFTPGPSSAPQPFTPGPSSAASQPFTPAALATQSAQPLTPGGISSASRSSQPFTPAMCAAAQQPYTPTEGGQPFTPAPGGGTQPTTPATIGVQPFTPGPAPAASTPASVGAAQPITPAMAAAMPITPVADSGIVTPVRRRGRLPSTPVDAHTVTYPKNPPQELPGTPGRRRRLPSTPVGAMELGGMTPQMPPQMPPLDAVTTQAAAVTGPSLAGDQTPMPAGDQDEEVPVTIPSLEASSEMPSVQAPTVELGTPRLPRDGQETPLRDLLRGGLTPEHNYGGETPIPRLPDDGGGRSPQGPPSKRAKVESGTPHAAGEATPLAPTAELPSAPSA